MIYHKFLARTAAECLQFEESSTSTKKEQKLAESADLARSIMRTMYVTLFGIQNRAAQGDYAKLFPKVARSDEYFNDFSIK